MAEVKTKAILPIKALDDQSGKEGYLVVLSETGGTVAAAADADVRGVILDGNDQGYNSDVAILGTYHGTAHFKLSGAAKAGQPLMLQADGTVKYAATGKRVGIALENGVAGELIEGAPVEPITVT